MIVAEIGQNFCGDIKLAEKLIRLAKENGADAVKFQLYDSRKLYGKKQKSELSRQQAFHVFDYATKEIGIDCWFSVFDTERIKWCEDMGVRTYKLAFSQRNNMHLINCIKSIPNRRLIVSSDSILPHLDPEDTVYLYCVPKYPATESDIWWMQDTFKDFRWAGFSDHFIGTNVAKILYMLGAFWLEKHFAIDHKTGVDAPWSMTPDELLDLCKFRELKDEICGQ